MKYDAQNIADGIYDDMPIEVYHENKTHLSASSIKESFKSNAHFKAYLDSDKKRQSYFDFGNAFELSITDNAEFEKNVAIFDANERPEIDKTFASTKNKEWKNTFYKDNENKLIIQLKGADSLDVLTLCKSSLYKHQAGVSLLKNTSYQTSLFWTCPETGLKLKTRPDFWKPANKKRSAVVADLKTDKDSESDKHLRAIYDRNYPIQAVIQLKGLKHYGLVDEGVRFFWIVCSKSAPYNTEVYEFDTVDITDFDDAVDFKLEELARAYKSGIFLSYDPNNCMGVKTVPFPIWYKKKLGVTEKIDNLNKY